MASSKTVIEYQKRKLLQKFECIARHIENTDQCMLTLPCKFTDKRVRFTVEVIDE